jgi:hypothetical protein
MRTAYIVIAVIMFIVAIDIICIELNATIKAVGLILRRGT